MLVICNTYRFSTATVVTRTCLNVTLHVHCLSCVISKSLVVVSWNTCTALMSQGIRQTTLAYFVFCSVYVCFIGPRSEVVSTVRIFYRGLRISGLRSLCTVPIIFHVSGFPDFPKLKLPHCHTHFRVYVYHIFYTSAFESDYTWRTGRMVSSELNTRVHIIHVIPPTLSAFFCDFVSYWKGLACISHCTGLVLTL